MEPQRITPEPTDEEAAAIAAALVVVTAGPAQVAEASSVPRWRFSGRWWTAPVSVRRPRP